MNSTTPPIHHSFATAGAPFRRPVVIAHGSRSRTSPSQRRSLIATLRRGIARATLRPDATPSHRVVAALDDATLRNSPRS